MSFLQNQTFPRIGLIMAAVAVVLLCVVPALGQDTGAATFKAKCAMCHGADGQGKTPMGAKLSIPSLSAPEVQKQTDAALVEARKAAKPIGFVCIAPAIAAKLFGPDHLEFTIGTDAGTAQALAASGGKHVQCNVFNAVVDKRLKIVTTPAYMLGQRISEVESGIHKLVHVILEMA